MRRCATLLVVLWALPTVGVGAAPQDNSDFVGVWRAMMDDLPAVVMTVTDEGDSLSGAILFYLIRRDEGKPPTSSPGIPEPMFNLKFNEKVLSFKVSHRRAHPGTQSDPPGTFRLRVTGPDEGVLVRREDDPDGLKMVRDKH